MKKATKSIWDHLFVCLIVFLLGWLLVFASVNISIFNPLKQVLDDFKMTDVYFEMLRSGKDKELNDDIVLVDMTKQTNRKEIAGTINAINACAPKVLMVDLVFQRPNSDITDDTALIEAVEAGRKKEIFSFKLIDYNPEKGAFRGAVKSFFDETDEFAWGYSNILQKRPGSTVRLYTLTQQLGDTTVFSMPYLAACRYMGKQPKSEDKTQRLIIYSNTDFPVINCDSVAEQASLMKDKIVILGALNEEADMHITPIGKEAGMKVQAFSILSYMEHPSVRNMGKITSLILAFFLCLFCAWVGWHIRKRFPVTYSYVLKLFYFLLAAVLVWLSFLSFVYLDYEADLLYPLLGIALVEEARIQYAFLIRGPLRKYKQKLAEKSTYYQ